MTACFRLSSSKFSPSSGAGSALHGGRWNPKGFEVLYAASSISLAALEVLVHYSVLPLDFVLTEIRLPSGLAIESVELKDLPANWNVVSPSVATQDIGRRWLEHGKSAVMSVPSTIVPTELIYVLNPGHRDFELLDFRAPVSFRFDSRLK